MSTRSGRGMFGKLFVRKPNKEREERATEIGMPTNVKQHIHVSKNSETGMLEGLPSSWQRLLDTQITAAEQSENPDAAIQAVKFHMFSMKNKKAAEPFKPFVTPEAITKEDLEIEKLLDHKNAHQSQDSDLSIGQSSEEENLSTGAIPLDKFSQRQTMPTSPTKRSIKKKETMKDLSAVVEDLSVIGDDKPEDESPILRKKELQYATLNDEEIYEELKNICNKDDPYVRFERIKQLGAGASGKIFTFTFTQKQFHTTLLLYEYISCYSVTFCYNLSIGVHRDLLQINQIQSLWLLSYLLLVSLFFSNLPLHTTTSKTTTSFHYCISTTISNTKGVLHCVPGTHDRVIFWSWTNLMGRNAHNTPN